MDRDAIDPERASAGAALPELVTRLRRALRAAVRNEIPWERLPMAQVELLQDLADRSDQRISELAATRRLATNTVSNVVQQMVQAGLAERQPDPLDRRAVAVRATPEGLEALAGWTEANESTINQALGMLSEADQDAINSAIPALERLVTSLETTASDTASASPWS